MALNKAVITPAEADVFLALYPLWLALTDPVKEGHIAKASVHMQTKWSCLGVGWDVDPLVLSDDLAEACAYYSLASFKGNLYPDPGVTSSGVGLVVEESDAIGTLKTSKKYSDTKSVQTASAMLIYPDALMATACTRLSGGGSVKAIRD